MADSEQVLEYLDPPDDVEIIGIVVNEKGAQRAIATEAVRTLGFPYSVSPSSSSAIKARRRKNRWTHLEAIGQAAFKAGLGVVAYISMAFGNPYGDLWSIDEIIAACDLLADMGIEQISLADTVGVATPDEVARLVSAVLSTSDNLEIGVHLHARPEEVAAKVSAAYRAGCRRFDMAIGGLGGCPFAQDALVGNIATEIAVAELERLGAELPPLQPLDGLLTASHGIAEKFGPTRQ